MKPMRHCLRLARLRPLPVLEEEASMSNFSITMPSGETWEPKFVQNINEDTCIGCGRCFKVCPRGVLELVGLNEEGERVAISDDDDEDDIVDMEPRVPIFTDDDSYVVCSLIPEKVEQVTLNLQISEEEEVGLSVSGDEPVDIIGNYLLPTSLNDLDPELLGELEDEEDDEAPRDRKLIEGPRDDDDEDDEDEEDDDEDDDDEEDDDEEDEEDDEDEDEDGDIVIEDDDDDDDDDEDDEDDDEVLVEEDDDNDDDEEDIVIVPSKKRSVSDLDEDEPKLSRSQRKRLNKKLKAEASGQKQDKVRDVMASMLTDVLFNF